MRCLRCRGMMVEERVVTMEGGIAMARCVCCGDLIDPVVIRNRTTPCTSDARGGRHYGLGLPR
ncbi:MAG: hypothetical protein EPO39_18685 [Candidatus Manganitrophaceae bacterium]|nr:MAG: hypothetical protein EPO39_18685 [Candidatus Manganitrophaceae bacterium]